MQALQKSLDLQDELDEVRERAESLQRDIDELVDEANAIDPAETDDEEERMAQIRAEVAALDQQKTTVEGYVEALDRALSEWDGSEVVIKELTGAEYRRVSDEVHRKVQQRGFDEATESIHEPEFLKEAVVTTPPGCPDPERIGDLPNRLFDWLLGRANTLNSTGEFDAGNSSLREKMMDREGQT